jgi:hypothetical protein
MKNKIIKIKKESVKQHARKNNINLEDLKQETQKALGDGAYDFQGKEDIIIKWSTETFSVSSVADQNYICSILQNGEPDNNPSIDGDQ